jgi:AcrR family transcriptional regulator
MARPQQVSTEEILRVAREVFLTRGPAVSTEVIAAELKVSQPALFKRFGSKKELMLAALCPKPIPGWTEEIAAGPDERELRVQLREISSKVAAFFAEISPCMMILRASGIDVEEVMGRYETPPPVRATRAVQAWLARAQARGLVRDVDPHDAATSILGALHMRQFMCHIAHETADPPEFESYADELIEFLARGLEPRSSDLLLAKKKRSES